MKTFLSGAFAAALCVAAGVMFGAQPGAAQTMTGSATNLTTSAAGAMVAQNGYDRRDRRRGNRRSSDAACYWLRPQGGWQAMPQYASKRACFAQDSCDGGLGRSGGGCYKWATGPDATRESWGDDDRANDDLFNDQNDEFGDDGDVYPDGNDGYGHRSNDNDRGHRRHHRRSAHAACYWLRPQGGWQAMPQYASKHACFKQDSCDGGQGRSGGGCYKWADGPNAPRHAW
ncbi:MAG TPA: hypothetical protein VFI93_12660 [Rhizomicrobium sp.]|nr:hypothetical protein [Rhizomicrobium sp.]